MWYAAPHGRCFRQVLERYEYDDYGLPTVLSPSGSVRDESMVNNTRMFTGRLWDKESRLYQYRHRYMEPTLGRFVQRDPLACLSLARGPVGAVALRT